MTFIPDPYGRSTFHGEPLDNATIAALKLVEQDLGYELTIYQGIGNYSASATTHLKGRVVDLSDYDAERKLKALKRRGFAPFLRYARDFGTGHIHAILIFESISNSRGIDDTALRQVESYLRGRDGLKGDGPDDHPWRVEPQPVFTREDYRATFKEKEPDVPSTVLKFQYSSLQYSDGVKKQSQDINDLFTEGTAFPVKSGTEAGADRTEANANRRLLIEAAGDFDHYLEFWRDNWIAVDRKIVVPRTFSSDSVFVADNDETFGHGHDSGFVTVTFEHREPGVSEVNVAACHLPTNGRDPREPNFDINARYSDYLGNWAKKAARGGSIAFVVGDFNRPDDRRRDFLIKEQHLTSAGDELEKWENSGHGPIDGIMSYDRDGRVSAKWVNILNDKEFFQHSDHFVGRAAFEIKHRKEK